MLEDVLDDGAVLPRQLEGASRHRRGLVDQLGVHPEAGPTAADARPDHRSLHAPDDERPKPARQVACILDVGHGADARVTPLGAGHEQDATVASQCGIGRGCRLTRFEGEGHDHLRKDHPCGQGQDRKRGGAFVGFHGLAPSRG